MLAAPAGEGQSGVAISRSSSSPLEEPIASRRINQRWGLLTTRERQVLGMVAMGMSSAWIAAALKVSPYTVETHVRYCLDKLRARNRTHAIALGLRSGEIGRDFGGP